MNCFLVEFIFWSAFKWKSKLSNLILLIRVAQSPNTKMDVANLAKVFGPTIVAHAVPNPDPVTMLQDIKRQPKVGMGVCIDACLCVYVHIKCMNLCSLINERVMTRKP